MTPFLCLAAAIYFEAGNQPIEGKYAVADVILTRVASSRFPDDICGVVYQSKQFSFTHDGKSDDINRVTNVLDVTEVITSKLVARDVMDGYTPAINADHYHADYANPYWMKSMQVVATVGSHVFYISR